MAERGGARARAKDAGGAERSREPGCGSRGPGKRRAKAVVQAPNGEVRRGRQVIRHLRIAAALAAAPRGLTAKELFEIAGDDCDLRTIYRDIEQLEQAGFGLIEESGHRFRLAQNAARWRLPVDTPELLALLLAEQALRPLLGTELAAPLLSLKQKLLSALTPQGRAYCEELCRVSVATTSRPEDLTGRETIVATLHDAVLKEQPARIAYMAPRRALEVRDVEPYATWYAGGRLYLIARCLRAKAVRTFSVARIRSAEILDETFDVDPAFRLDEFVQRGFGVYHGERHRIAVDFGPEVAHLASERRYHPSQTVEELGQGRVRLRFEAAGLPEVAAWLAGFGGGARAVEPPELVDLVREMHESGLSQYR